MNNGGILDLNIKKLNINNMMIFDKFEINFTKGINTIKYGSENINTAIIKIIYAMHANDKHIGKCNFDLAYTYLKTNTISLVNDKENIFNKKPIVKVTYEDKSYFEYDLLKYEGFKFEIDGIDKYCEYSSDRSTFIPSGNILKRSNKILRFNKKYNSSFDKTYVDIIKKLQLSCKKNISQSCNGILNIISKAIGGVPYYDCEDEKFFILKSNNEKIELVKESQEDQKFSILYLLVKCGYIGKDKILFWDNPYEYLSESYISILKNILRSFEKDGIQIFITNLNFNKKNRLTERL